MNCRDKGIKQVEPPREESSQEPTFEAQNSAPTFSRRQALALGAVAIGLGTIGCGGGGAGGETPPVEVQGLFNVPGTNPSGVRVVSAFDSSGAPLAADYSFVTKVSGNMAQIIFAVDSNDDLRGMALSLPDARGRGPSDLKIDVSSIAMSAIFLTPGILTVDRDEALVIANQMVVLPEFIALRNTLEGALQTNSLGEVIQSDPYNSALAACISAYVASRQRSRGVEVSPERHRTWIVQQNSGREAEGLYQFEVRNRGYRWLALARQDLSAAGGELTFIRPTPRNLIHGAIPLSWGSLFTNSVNSPSELRDSMLVNFGAASTTKYWFAGPGNRNSGAYPPQVDTFDHAEAGCATFTFYVLFPLLDILAGGLRVLGEANRLSNSSDLYSDMEKIVGQLKRIPNFAALFGSVQNATDIQSSQRAQFNLVIAFIPYVLDAMVGTSLGSSIAAVASGLTLLLAILAASMSLANLTQAALDWWASPSIHSISASANADGSVTIR